MKNEQSPAASVTSGTGTSNPGNATMNSSSVSNGRQAVPQISVYSSIPDRQTVQVIQQALHRQPNTAAQYLQQMYAAQQQHLMLQTAALQQQHHLSSAQLQSLATVQQASIAAGRQCSNQNGTTSQQTGSSQTTVSQTTFNLATSQAAAHLISRAQGVNSSPSGIAQQTVLLGNTSNPAITASQAQMYLRAQMLIFTPTATVAAVQPDASALSACQQSAPPQVQNLAIRSQSGAAAVSPSQTQRQGLNLKLAPGATQVSVSSQPAVQLKGPSLGVQGPGVKGGAIEVTSEGGKKGDTANELARHGVNVSCNVTAVNSQPLLSPAFTQIQTHQFLQQHKQQQFVIQQPQMSQRTQAQLLQTASIQPQLQAQTVQTLAIQPTVVPQPQSQPFPISVLPKPTMPNQQATIFQYSDNSQVLTQNGQPPLLSQTVPPIAQSVQLAAVNLQIQPVPAQNMDSKDRATTLVAKETCPTPTPTPNVQKSILPTFGSTTTEQQKKLITAAAGAGATESVNAKQGVGSSQAMTSGNGSNAPSVTGSTPQNGENKPPQAIVKPQILTHVIEGFVIQEGAEPFPLERPSLLIENLKKQKLQPDSEKQSQNNPASTIDSEMDDLAQNSAELKNPEDEPTLKCELCGLVDFAYKFKRSKRFCSTLCAKRYNVGFTKRVGLFHSGKNKTEKHKKRRSRSGNNQGQSTEAKKRAPSTLQPSPVATVSSPLPSHPSQGESSQCSDMSSYEEPPSPLSAASSGALRMNAERGQSHSRELPFLMQHFLPTDPTQWNVENVYAFISSLPGCQEIAEEFRSQEIDGQALLLLNEDHLMSTMNIKLGPALKIFARISMLKDS